MDHSNFGAKTSIAYEYGNISESRYDKTFMGFDGEATPAVVVVDSHDRNRYTYENANNYTVILGRPYKEVVSIELVNADIPNSGYVIENTRNQLHFQDTQDQVDNGTYHTILIPVGNYTIDADSGLSIRKNLEDEMNEESESTYQVTVNTYQKLITIEQTSGSGIFNLLFKGTDEKYGIPFYDSSGSYNGKTKPTYRSNSVGQVLGFKMEDYTGETTYTGAYSYNLSLDKYLVMNVNSFSRLDSVNSNVQDSFCVIPLDTSINNFSYTKNSDQINNDRHIVIFNEPIPELNKLEIKITDANGDLFNFNGTDHVLIFAVRSNTRKGKYIEK